MAKRAKSKSKSKAKGPVPGVSKAKTAKERFVLSRSGSRSK